MPRLVATVANLALVLLVLASLLMGVSWRERAPSPQTHIATATASGSANVPKDAPRASATTTPIPGDVAAPAPTLPPAARTVTPAPSAAPSGAQASAPPSTFNRDVQIEAGDAPQVPLAPNTINFLLLGSDAAADERYARTDTIMVASINPDLPSVSLLSFPRDLQVKMPGRADDRINTVMEFGNVMNYPGGGVSYLAAVLRKNFGIKIDHFVRVDFNSFVKAVETLGGVEVLVECELHDTFPDKDSPRGRTDLDLEPGKVTLSGKQALWFSRSRWSTSDFDRARRQQKVLRAMLSKARRTNLLQNALPLYTTFRENVQTDVGLTDLPVFVDIARRMDDLSIKSRVLTFPAVKAITRRDGAQVLAPADDILNYITEALSPPVTNRTQNLPRVEVYNATGKADMEWVAAERLAWEGFAVVGTGKQSVIPTTSLVDYSVTPKGSPVARLQQIFNVAKANVKGEGDPSSVAAARIILGQNYDSCPNTYQQSRDVTIETDPRKLIPTPTPTQR